MDWKISQAPVDYEDAVKMMESRVENIIKGSAGEQVWLLEHPPVYTAGTSAQAADLLNPAFTVHQTGRGGQYTYHGPGQRVGYVMLDLNQRNPDLRDYVQKLERWIILTLAEFGVKGELRDGRVGVWVVMPDRSEAKIAALGVRVKKWVTYHGISLNVNPDLSHYAGIVPCGISEHGITSLYALGVKASMEEVDAALKKNFGKVF